MQKRFPIVGMVKALLLTGLMSACSHQAFGAAVNFQWSVFDLKKAFDETNGVPGQKIDQFALYDLYARPVICASAGDTKCLQNVAFAGAISPTFSGTGGYTTTDDDWGASTGEPLDTPFGYEGEWAHFYDRQLDAINNNFGTIAFITDYVGPIDFTDVPDFVLMGQTHAHVGTDYYNVPESAIFKATITTTQPFTYGSAVRWNFVAYALTSGAEKYETFNFYVDTVGTPEPGTWSLMAGGLCAALLFRRSRRA
ncbi:MAG TPA: PEP-CTERM sorting domain-containing protein [Bryobacteraceae bacterium]|nr:PEP-CTERM sorting domain-containing protein [Bryobacteraceae bacterium]